MSKTYIDNEQINCTKQFLRLDNDRRLIFEEIVNILENGHRDSYGQFFHLMTEFDSDQNTLVHNFKCMIFFIALKNHRYYEVKCMIENFNIDHNNLEYSGNDTPLTIAVDNMNIDMVNMLLDLGADINANVNQSTILDRLITARNNDDTGWIELLLNRGADPNMKFVDWQPYALEYAFEKKYMNIVKILIEHGGDKYLDAFTKMKIFHEMKKGDMN